MPIEFIQEPQPTGSSGDTLFRLSMAYDGSGRRISKTRWVKNTGSQDWEKELVTHYTSIGTEIRESFTGANAETRVVVNMPNDLGRYGIEDAVQSAEANASQKFEWYLKNHLGSTMLVYGTVASTNPSEADVGEKIAAYDYRSFGEMVELTPPATGKVTENFTGKEKDDETELNYFGARYLDPMLGMWISIDPKRQFANPYLYAGNGMNPVNGVDPDGNVAIFGAITGVAVGYSLAYAESQFTGKPVNYTVADMISDAAFGALGLTFLKQAKKAYEARTIAKSIKETRNLRRPKWRNEYNEANEEMYKGLAGVGAAIVGKAMVKLPLNEAEKLIVDEDPAYMEKLHDNLSDWANERMNAEMRTDFSDSHGD